MTMRKYRPTERDREIVLRMAAIPNISRDNIAFCITNERTGKAIDRHTLEKNFAKELELATSQIQNLVMKSFIEMIAEKNWPAVKTGLMNYCGLKDSGEAVANANVQVNLSRAEREGIVVTFEEPTNKEPPPSTYDPRPLPKWPESLRKEISTHPHRIEHEATPPPKPDPPPDDSRVLVNGALDRRSKSWRRQW